MLRKLLNLLAACGLATLTFSFLVTALMHPPGRLKHPTTARDIKFVSAKVDNGSSRGTATVITSGPHGSDFLTNDHVCEDAKTAGSTIILDNNSYTVTFIKPNSEKDLCLMHVEEDVHASVELAPEAPKMGDEFISGGYPISLPLVVQRGYISQVYDMNYSSIAFFREYRMLTSMLVQHGHSGSGLFNTQGQLIGVISNLRVDRNQHEYSIGFGLSVPYSDLKQFLTQDALNTPWTEVPHAPRH